MDWFHHPDISIPVIRRRIGVALLETLAWGAGKGPYGFLTHGGCPEAWVAERAYQEAVRRLAAQGLVAHISHQGRSYLALTPGSDPGQVHTPDPATWWRARWRGRWYLVTYDVPEGKRAYRVALQRFLAQERFGCLHRSVWVSARDVRPLFDDLEVGAGVGDVAFLFESQSVLGLPDLVVAEAAWDWRKIARHHQWYMDGAARLREDLASDDASPGSLITMLRENADAYRTALAPDPLLPAALHPRGYRGMEVVEAHHSAETAIRGRLAEIG